MKIYSKSLLMTLTSLGFSVFFLFLFFLPGFLKVILKKVASVMFSLKAATDQLERKKKLCPQRCTMNERFKRLYPQTDCSHE